MKVGCAEHLVLSLEEGSKALLVKSEALRADLPTDAVTMENLTITFVFLPMSEKTSA